MIIGTIKDEVERLSCSDGLYDGRMMMLFAIIIFQSKWIISSNIWDRLFIIVRPDPVPGLLKAAYRLFVYSNYVQRIGYMDVYVVWIAVEYY